MDKQTHHPLLLSTSNIDWEKISLKHIILLLIFLRDVKTTIGNDLYYEDLLRFTYNKFGMNFVVDVINSIDDILKWLRWW